MTQETYAVIGSNCFSGSHIVDRLLQDPQNVVFGFSKSPERSALVLPYKKRVTSQFQFCQVDLFRETRKLISLLDEFQPSYVINVAALSEVVLSNFQPLEYFHTNCLGVVHLCNELRTRSYLKRYIHISSAEVYGSCNKPLSEDAALNPGTPYAASKAAADFYLLTLHRNFGFPVLFVRSTNVFGKHQQLYKIIPRTMIYLKQGKPISLHGGGVAIKTWVHIRDMAEGVIKTIQLGRPGQIYHFSDQHSYSVASLVRTVCELLGYDFESCAVPVEERLGQDTQYLLNYEKAQKELKWSPQVPFIEGLKEVDEWLVENWDQIQKESQVYVHQP